MCGRYVLTTPGEALAEIFGLDAAPALVPRYNIAPTQPVPVVRHSERELATVRWGLIPHWAKDARQAARLINARSETADRKPAFRDAFRRRRCLVPASGFYEWQGTGRHRQPHYIHPVDDRPLAIAGLWERWSDPAGAVVESCTLLTTIPNKVVQPLHDRMPVILPAAAHEIWLDPAASRDQLRELLVPCPDDLLTAHPVDPLVNSPREDAPRCIEPLLTL